MNNSQNFGNHRSPQFELDKLPQIIEAVASDIRDLPPESVGIVAPSISRLVSALAELVAKNQKL